MLLWRIRGGRKPPRAARCDWRNNKVYRPRARKTAVQLNDSSTKKLPRSSESSCFPELRQQADVSRPALDIETLPRNMDVEAPLYSEYFLNTLSYMKLKKHLISMGIPEAEVLIFVSPTCLTLDVSLSIINHKGKSYSMTNAMTQMQTATLAVPTNNPWKPAQAALTSSLIFITCLLSPDDTHFIRVFHDRTSPTYPISPTDDTSLHITSIKDTHINC